MLTSGYYEAGKWDPAEYEKSLSQGTQDMAALFEGAGCLDPAWTFQQMSDCYQESLASGAIQDSSTKAGHYANLTAGCKAGGVASCSSLLRKFLDADLECPAEYLMGLHPNISCNCATESCTEIEALTPQQRQDQQVAATRGAMAAVPTWAWWVGGGAIAWWLWRR